MAPALDRLKKAYDVIAMARQSKIAQAARMEKAMENAHGQARKARIRAAEQQKKQASKLPSPEEDSEGLGLNPIALDPDLLLEEAKEKLLAIADAKSKRRRKPNTSPNE